MSHQLINSLIRWLNSWSNDLFVCFSVSYAKRMPIAVPIEDICVVIIIQIYLFFFFLHPIRLMTPQLVFRLIFVIVLTLIPASVYQSSKILGLRPLHGASLCLLTFAIQSWRKFGLEISAFIEYGLLTQAFGMLLLFPVGMQIYIQ